MHGCVISVTPTKIAVTIHEAGSTNKLTGFHVWLAISKFSCKGILTTDWLKLCGESEDHKMYYHLASVTDAETPFTQHVSESGDHQIVVTKDFFDARNFKDITFGMLLSLESLCKEKTEEEKDLNPDSGNEEACELVFVKNHLVMVLLKI
jgi:hypothetical protein